MYMSDMQFGITMAIFGGGLTLLTLGFLVFVMKALVGVQKKTEDKKQAQNG
jgi:Na+-transporting methylmalonyl-CoA/oxaloacetate decarboxylase gamma subunit